MPLVFQAQHCLLWQWLSMVSDEGFSCQLPRDFFKLEIHGIKPGTFCMQSQRSTTEPYAFGEASSAEIPIRCLNWLGPEVTCETGTFCYVFILYK